MSKLLNVQFVFFPKSFSLKEAERLEFLTKFKGLFDGRQMVLPIPDDAPENVPRMTLTSKDDLYQLAFAKSRIDLHYNIDKDNVLDESKMKDFILGDFNKLLVSIFDILLTEDDFRCGAVGCILRTIKDVDGEQDKVRELLADDAKELFTESDKASLNLYYTNKLEADGFKLNHAERFISGVKDEAGNMLILTEFDYNTKDDTNSIESKDLLEKFLNKIVDDHLAFLKKSNGILDDSDLTTVEDGEQ